MKYYLLLIIPLLVSNGFAVKCQDGWSPTPEGVCQESVSSADQSKWVSDEKPPKNPQPEWETGKVGYVDIKPENPADEHHPADCPNACKWTGAECLCSDQGKKP